MKTLIILNALILNLIFSNSILSQNKSYLEFFGHKYFLQGTLYEKIKHKYSILPQISGNQYIFYGKNILQVRTKNFTSEPINLEAWKDSVSYKNYRDTIKEPNITYYISNISNEIVNVITLNNVIDSISIKKITTGNNFTVFSKGKEQLIYGFKILGDSLDYEIAYNISNLYSYKVDPKSDNKAKEYLLKILDENKNCTKFVIKDIYIYDKKKKINYYLYLEIILIR